MYARIIRDRAFELWAIHGNDETVAEVLRKEFSAARNLDRKTVGKWRLEDGWIDRAAAVREKHHEQQDESLAEAIGDMEERLKDEIDKVFMSLKALEPKSFAEAVHSLPTLTKQLRTARGEDGDKGDWRHVLAKVIKVMMTIPALKIAMTDEVRNQFVAEVEKEFGKT